MCFPIDLLDAECFNAVTKDGKRVFSETVFQVMLAAVIATMAAVSWIEDEPAMSGTGHNHGDADSDSSDSSDSSSSSSSSSTQANSMSDADKSTRRPLGSLKATMRGCLLRRVLHDPAQKAVGGYGPSPGHAC